MTTRSNTTIAPMLTQSHASNNQFPMASPRLLDGPSAEEAAAAAATEAAAAAAAAATAAAAKTAKETADAEAEAARIAASTMTPEAAALLKDSMAHKKAAKDAKEALDAANARLKDFEGLDAAEIKTLVAAQKTAKKAADDAATAALEAAGEYTRVKEQMVTAHKSELEAVTAAGASSQAALDAALRTIDDLTVGSNFNSSVYVQEQLVLTPKIARTVYGPHFDTVDGVVVGHDKPRGTKDRTPLVGADGKALAFDDAMKRLIETDPEKDKLIKSATLPGARSQTAPGAKVVLPAAKGLRGQARIQASLVKNGAPVAKK